MMFSVKCAIYTGSWIVLKKSILKIQVYKWADGAKKVNWMLARIPLGGSEWKDKGTELMGGEALAEHQWRKKRKISFQFDLSSPTVQKL